MISHNAPLTNLGETTSLLFFPSYGFRTEDGAWRMLVTGTAYRPQVVRLQKRLLVKVLRRVMRAEPGEFETELFQQRIRPFLAAPHRGRRLALRLGSDIYRLPRRSRRNGHFRATIALPAERAALLANDGWVDFDTLTISGCTHWQGGPRVQLLDGHGLSVVSDIDDTIKLSGVGCRRTLLANTFLRDFQSIQGMAQRYQQWAAGGASFHYVSSSPWQLYEPLEAWRRSAGFPSGSIHLRQFRLRDQMIKRLLRMRRHGKAGVIRQLIRRFPRRQFVLIGDSTELDPEIYAALARRFPEQVAAIRIRQTERRPLGGERLERVFRGLPPELWSLFHHADELPDVGASVESCIH